MRYPGYFAASFVILFASHFIFVRTAYAYLDPGSGSYIFQLMMGALLGVFFAIRIYWKKFKDLISKPFLKNRKET